MCSLPSQVSNNSDRFRSSSSLLTTDLYGATVSRVRWARREGNAPARWSSGDKPRSLRSHGSGAIELFRPISRVRAYPASCWPREYAAAPASNYVHSQTKLISAFQRDSIPSSKSADRTTLILISLATFLHSRPQASRERRGRGFPPTVSC